MNYLWMKILIFTMMLILMVFDAWLLWQLYHWLMEHGRLVK
jgi:hypothetical protein